MSHLVRTGLAAAALPLTAATARLRPGVRILMYHRVRPTAHFDQLTVTPERFAEQMTYLTEHCQVIPLEQAVTGLQRQAGRLSAGRQQVVITFDDGYLDNLVHALPILQRLRLAATIFVAAEFSDQTLQHPRYPREPGRTHLNWAEIRALAGVDGITIGSHTLSHPFLQRLSEDRARSEIADSRAVIENRIGRSVDYFCYPSGDVGPREAALAARAGYRASVTVAPGLNRPGAELQTLRRTEVTQNDARLDFALKLHGGFDPVHAVLHWRRQHQQRANAYTRLST